MTQRRDRTECPMQSRQIVAQVSSASRRGAVGCAIEGHETGLGFRQWIVANPVVVLAELTEAADRNVDYVWLYLAALLIADAPLVEGARTEILDDDIYVCGELEKNLAALAAPKVQGETTFVAVN